ncbi:hypothetical protein NECAME_01547 [Necator americanus]|uniref:guanylate cyclase n=1 Tax=Necator americanus TaxID=51031 RepID=W2TSE7_NECAM|nr:hypothetical protein NECAME_01547 [Necator americanus]ETN84985.1 hypothetical protein NECAME_01547 [Necator americanus]
MSTKVIAIGADFENLKEALDRLDVRGLSSQHYIVIVLCDSPVENCFADSGARSTIADSDVIVLAPYMENYAMASARLSSLISNPVQTSKIMDAEFLTDIQQQQIKECLRLGNCQNHIDTASTSIVCIGKSPKDQLKIIENKQANFKGSKAGEGISGKRRTVASYALLGSNKAEFIGLRHLKKIKWTKPELKFLYDLRQLNHDNLATFLGICANELENFYILYALIDRASLEDFIKDPDFPIDDLFRSAFLRDILKGLQYLHKSPIRYHGLLITKHCLVDSNWVLKLTHFGVANFPMFAPELLKETENCDNYPRGSPQGDIYSLGMILYWLMYREDPFSKTGLRGRALVAEILKRRLKPEVDDYDGSPEQKASALTRLMKECYTTASESRPSLRNVLTAVNKAFSAS